MRACLIQKYINSIIKYLMQHHDHRTHHHYHQHKEPHEHQQFQYNSFQTNDGNQIWGGALTLAWKQLEQKYTKGPAKINLSQNIANNFHLTPFSKQDLKEQYYFIKSGYGQSTIEQINHGVLAKFPHSTIGTLDQTIGVKDLVVYAYFNKIFQYNYPFQRRQAATFKFNGKEVKSFYASNETQFDQVRVDEYLDEDNFVVSLNDDKTSDRMYLLKSNQSLTVKLAVQKAIKFSKVEGKFDNLVGQGDKFEMPIIDIDCTHQWSQLAGAQFQGDHQISGYKISDILEGFKLNIDQKGAKVQNYGVLFINECCIMKMSPSRQIILNKPFWVVMMENGKHPYLCVHVTHI